MKAIRFALPILLGTGAIAAGAQTVAQPVLAPGATRLDLVAEGSVTRVPDVAQVGAGVVTQGRTAGGAMSDNAARMAATVAALRKAGVEPRDIQTSAINLAPQYRYADNQPPVLTGYQASNQVTVRLRDVARAGSVLDALVAAGANQINGPTLMVDKPEAALDEARGLAVTAARRRAELYARAAGLKVTRILAISENGDGMPLPPMPMIMMASRGKAADTSVEAAEEPAAEDRADDTDADVQEDSLLPIGAHDDAGQPADHTADDEKKNETHVASSSCFTAEPLF